MFLSFRNLLKMNVASSMLRNPFIMSQHVQTRTFLTGHYGQQQQPISSTTFVPNTGITSFRQLLNPSSIIAPKPTFDLEKEQLERMKDTTISNETMQMDSVKRKRRRKIKRHKYRKRLRETRAERKRLGK